MGSLRFCTSPIRSTLSTQSRSAGILLETRQPPSKQLHRNTPAINDDLYSCGFVVSFRKPFRLCESKWILFPLLVDTVALARSNFSREHDGLVTRLRSCLFWRPSSWHDREAGSFGDHR